jgi:replicative DNA helicase
MPLRQIARELDRCGIPPKQGGDRWSHTAIVRILEGYDEPLNVYVMVAQPPASRKTFVFREVLHPVEVYEREMATQARPAIAEARTQLEIDKKILEELERKASKSQDEVERAAPNTQQMPR